MISPIFKTRSFIHNIWTKSLDQLSDVELITGVKELKKHIYYVTGCLKRWNSIILTNPPDIKKNKKHVTQYEILEQFRSFVPSILPDTISLTHSHIISYSKGDICNLIKHLEDLISFYNDISIINEHCCDPQIVPIIYGFKLVKSADSFKCVKSSEEEFIKSNIFVGYEVFSDIFTFYTGEANKILKEYEIKRHKGCYISCKELFGIIKKDRTNEMKLYTNYNVYLVIITQDIVDIPSEFSILIELFSLVKNTLKKELINSLSDASQEEILLSSKLYNFLFTFSYKNNLLKFKDALKNASDMSNKTELIDILFFDYNPIISPWDCLMNCEFKKEIAINWINNLKRMNIVFHKFNEMRIDDSEHKMFKSFVDELFEIVQ